MNILFVINTISKAGAEMALIELLKCLGNDHNIDLYILTSQGELIDSIPSNVNILNDHIDKNTVLSKEGRKHLMKMTAGRAFNRGSVFKNLPYMIGNAVKLRGEKYFRPENLLWRMVSDGAVRFDKKYDLAVAYLEGGATYYVAEHVNASKKVAFVHVDYSRGGYSRSLDKNDYAQFDRVYTVSDEVKGTFTKIYPEFADKTEVFHNLVDQDRIRRRAEEGKGFTDDFDGSRILTVGNLSPQKGYDIAIDAVDILKKRGLNIRWYVAGEGKCRAELEKKIADLGLENEFVLLGSVPNPYPYLKECDLYVHASRYEGKSIAIQEAITLGNAVIASDRSGNREQIRDGIDGVLCELSPEGIASAVERVLKDDELMKKLKENALLIRYDSRDDVEKMLALVEQN